MNVRISRYEYEQLKEEAERAHRVDYLESVIAKKDLQIKDFFSSQEDSLNELGNARMEIENLEAQLKEIKEYCDKIKAADEEHIDCIDHLTDINNEYIKRLSALEYDLRRAYKIIDMLFDVLEERSE